MDALVAAVGGQAARRADGARVPARASTARGATTGEKLPLAAHASYLINLAAASATIWERSTETLYEECVRAEALGVAQVIVHPGAARRLLRRGRDRARGARARRHLPRARRAAAVRLLLEITAGQGSCVGCSFAELAEMLARAGERRLGVCLDTQHMWAARASTGPRRAATRAPRRIRSHRRAAHLEAFHLNDSKKPLGARVDRHAVIGEGLIGAAPFRRLVDDARFADVPGFLETPPLPSGEESFALGLSAAGARSGRDEAQVLADPGAVAAEAEEALGSHMVHGGAASIALVGHAGSGEEEPIGLPQIDVRLLAVDANHRRGRERVECGGDLLADLEAAGADRRAERGAQPLATRADRDQRLDRGVGHAGDGAAPAGVRRGDAPFVVGEEDGHAVGGVDADDGAGHRADHDVGFGLGDALGQRAVDDQRDARAVDLPGGEQARQSNPPAAASRRRLCATCSGSSPHLPPTLSVA